MEAQQEIFTELLVRLKGLGYDVYDGFLPPEGVPYPFVYIGDNSQSDTGYKANMETGTVTQTVHVWHNSPKERGTLSKIMQEVKAIAKNIERTKNYTWYVRNLNQRVIPDTTTDTPLLHGIVEIDFRFS